MSTFEANLVDKLTAHAGLLVLVNARVYWVFAPDGGKAMPYLVLQEVGGQADYHQLAESTLSQTRVQFTAWAATRAGAKAIQTAVRDCLSGFRGSVGSGGTATAVVDCQREGGEIDIPTIAEDGSLLPIFGIACDYRISYRRTVPAG
jgi:hypothetical protein